MTEKDWHPDDDCPDDVMWCYAGNRITLHVCRTGAKRQYYTLYNEGEYHDHFGGSYYWSYYVQNLAHSEDVAMRKAEEHATELRQQNRSTVVRVALCSSPRPLYDKFTAFKCIIMKMNNKRTVWHGIIEEQTSETFWARWRAQKAAIKAAGFWVKKDRGGGPWRLYKRIREEEKTFVCRVRLSHAACHG